MRVTGIHGFLTLLLSVILAGSAFGQRKKIQYKSDRSVYLKTALGTGVYKLYENVRFEHEGAIMTCDSAYFYQKENSFDAFSNIHVNQGDTVHMYSESLHYSGKTRELVAHGNVRFNDNTMNLQTPSLRYNRITGNASYFEGGTIVDEENHLFSKIGTYNSNSEWFTFKDSVRLNSTKYSIESDTLLYHIGNGITRFRGPSKIKTDNGHIICTYGDYDTENDIAYFSKRSQIFDGPRILKGDSVYYDRINGIGDLFGDVYLADTVDNFVIRGEHAYYQERPEKALVTGNPLYTLMVEDDSVHIHGDTLQIKTDYLGKKRLRVYRNAKFYKKDFQGKCDSIVFNESDSIMNMYVNPVIWNNNSQLSADDIYFTLRNGDLDSIFMIKNAFVLSRVDSIKFDQVRGKNMKGKFKDGSLKSMFVNGNGQTVYTVLDKGVQQGINRADCSDLIIRFKEGDISKVVFIEKPSAKMYPLNEIPEGELFLRGFKQRFIERPNSKRELFLRYF